MQVIIRQYQQTDLDAVLNSWEVATRLAHEFMTDEFISEQRIEVEKSYLPNTDTWVAEVNGSVQGFISLMGNEVGAIFLQPEYHRLGIGKALINKAKSLHDELELEVFKVNQTGQKFYENGGFYPISESVHEITGELVLRLRYAAVT